MTTPNQDLTVYRGDAAWISIDLTGADGSAFVPAPSLEIRWRMAKTSHATDAEALIAKDLNNGISVVSGGVEIELSSADTDQPAGTYYHEMKLIDGNDVVTVLTGWLVIKRSSRMGLVAKPAGASATMTSEAPDT